MAQLQTIEALNERVKELSCLYDISTLDSDNQHLPELLQAVAERVALAWRYSESAVAEIVLKDQSYTSGKIPSVFVKMYEPVVLDFPLGKVSIYYPAPEFSQADFLAEEKQLLKKIAQEIAAILERSEREKKEEVLKRSIAQNDRLTLLGEITAGIAHELNTPLGNILGFSELIAESTQIEQVEKDASRIKASALYAREVVKKLMFFSCEIPQEMQSIALNPLVEDAIKLLMPTLQSAEVNIRFELDPNNPFGRLDPIQVTQVIFNLIINATHASPKGSTITVKLNSANKKIHFTIQDQGFGIPEEIQDKIFEPFFSSKDVGEGSGLGLSVVHGIVKSHKGSIIFSSDNTGTTFNVTLPLHP